MGNRHTSSQRQLRRTIPRSPQTGHVTGLIDQAYTACYKINVSVRIKIGDLLASRIGRHRSSSSKILAAGDFQPATLWEADSP